MSWLLSPSADSFNLGTLGDVNFGGGASTGDIIYRNGSNEWVNLGVGSNGQVLELSGGLPSWQTPAAGGLSDVVDDTTPELGGTLNSNYDIRLVDLASVSFGTSQDVNVFWDAASMNVTNLAAGQAWYWRDGTEFRFYDDSDTSYAQIGWNDVDSYGNLRLTGSTKNGYLGLSMDVSGGDTHTVMASTSNVGWYNDTDDQWLLRWADAGRVYFYRDGSTTSLFELQTYNATGSTTGAQVRDHGGSLRDVGYNILPLAGTNVDITVRAEHIGKVIYSNNSTSYSVTLDNSSDVPNGAVLTIANFNNTGTMTVIDGTGITLYWLNGTSSYGSGNRTIGTNSVATVWKHSSSAWFIWGNNIS